jgi:hypothetical protein
MSDDRTNIIQQEDDQDDDMLTVLITLTKIVSRMNVLEPDRYLQATLAQAQCIIERSANADTLKEITVQ